MRQIAPRPGRARLNFALFTIATLGAGWLGVAIDRSQGVDLANGVALSNTSGTTGQGLFLAGPVVAALVLYFVSRDGAGPLGFTLRFPHRARWFAFALALYPAITVAAIAVGLLAGAASLTATPAPGSPALLEAFFVVLGIQLVKNLFEEFIFRGYGTRTAMAMRLPGAYSPHLLVGVVWALWHLPLYLMWTSPQDLSVVTSLPWLFFAPMLILGICASAVVYGEMRVQTGSIWPGVLLHSMCNAIATPLLVDGYLTFNGHGDVLASPVPSALIAMACFAVTGVVLVRRRLRAGTGPDLPAPREADPATVASPV